MREHPPTGEQSRDLGCGSDHNADPAAVDERQLERAGAEAWEASRFDVAAPIYRRLCEAHPDDRHIAFRLATALAETGHLPEADHIFSQAVANDPTDFWMGIHWALKTFTYGDPERAELIARRLLASFPDHSDPYWHTQALLGDIAMKSLNPVAAVRSFEAACAAAPDNSDLRRKLERARLYGRVTDGWPVPLSPRAGYAAADYRFLYINLDRSTERRALLERAFVYCPPPQRIAGVPGNQLPRIVARHIGGGSEGYFGPGSLGCTLGHVSAWEFVVGNNLRHCLVIEDDAVPLTRFPPCFAWLNIPDDFDLCFVQEATEPRLDAERWHKFTAVPLTDAWRGFPDDFNAPRTTGYFISNKGARRLLDYFDHDGYGPHTVDWRIVAYSAASFAELPKGSLAAGVVEELHGRLRPPPDPLVAYSLYPSLVKEMAIDWPRLAIDAEEEASTA